MAKEQSKNLPATPAPAGLNNPADMPEYLKKGTGAGNENVKAEDLVIPRLQIIQPNSPELDADDSKFIPDCKQGQMFNSLTRELFESITVCDVFFRKEWAVFVKRTAGGGYRGAFPTQADAVASMADSDKPQDLEIVETALHFALVIDAAGKAVAEIVIPMTSTKLKVSRNLNSMIRMRGGDRFAGTYTITTKKEKNDKGTFFNFNVSPSSWVTEEVYARAQATYESIQAGIKDVDRSGMGGDSADDVAGETQY